MAISSHILFASLLCSLSGLPAGALELRSYVPATHDRFENFPESPSFNPTFLHDSEKLTGVGWGSESTFKQFALISRCHVVFAAHHAPAIGSQISFLNASGAIIERSVSKIHKVRNPTLSTSDVSLITLSSPISGSEGVEPLTYLNLPSEEDYTGLPLIVLGSEVKAGQGTLVDFRTINVNWIVSRTYRFDYLNSEGDAHDARLASGDSGSPSLTTVDGVPTLLGVHLATSTSDGVQSNYDAFIPHYVDDIDSLMEADGFRMRPLNSETTEIECSPSLAFPSFEQGQALALDFDLTNTGDGTTGNVEVEINFDSECAPDSVMAEGWIVSGGGTRWSLRRAILETGASTTIRAQWTSMPNADSIQPNIKWVSDSTSEESLSTSFTLTPGFSAWAAELPESRQLDDPDKDGIPNLIEYAFGSNPLSGSTSAALGIPPRPAFVVIGGIATYSFPERTDKDERGLTYSAEWLNESNSGGWSVNPPSGLSSSTTSFFPGVPGFSKRVLSWPIQESHRFIRLNISERVDEPEG